MPPERASRTGPDRRVPARHDSAAWPCLHAREGGCRLDLSVVPGARRTEVQGLHETALRVRLAAEPIEGRANDALVAWVADSLHLPRRAVRLVRGLASRRKQLEVDVPCETLERWLQSLPPRQPRP